MADLTVPGTPLPQVNSLPGPDTSASAPANAAPSPDASQAIPAAAPVPAPAPTPQPTRPLYVAPKNPAAEVNPYPTTVLDDPTQFDTVAKVAVSANQNTPPSAAAKSLELEMKTGIPAEFIQQDPDGFEKEMNQANFSPEQFVKSNPQLAQWVAQNPMHYSLIKGDLPNLKNMSDQIQEYGLLKDAYDALGSGTNQLFANTARIPGLLYDMAAWPQNYLATKYPEEFGNLETSTAGLPIQNKVAQFFENQAKAFTDENSDLNDSVTSEITKGNYARAGRVAFAKLVQSAPQLAEMMVGGAQKHALKLLLMGAQQSAESANRPENVAAGPVMGTLDALGQGAVAAGAGEVGTFGSLAKWGEALAASYGKATATAVVKSFINALTYSFTRDASSMAAMSVANDLTDYATGVNPNALEGTFGRALESGIIGGATGALMVSPSALLSAHSTVHDIRQAQLQKDFYTALGNTAEASQVKSTLPPKFQEIVSAFTKNGPLENVYADPDALEQLYQKKGPDELPKVLSDLGVQKEFDQAKDSGGMVKIPLADWSTKIEPQDYLAMADHVTLDPGQPTVAEAARASELAMTNEARVAESGGQYQDLGRGVIEQVSQKLQATGMDKATADKNASLYNFFNVLAQSENTTPEELFQRYNLDINRELPDQLQAKNIDEFDPILNRLRNGQIPSEREAYGQSLIDFLKSKGGVNTKGPGSDVQAMDIPGLTKRMGMELDRAAESAHEAGYLKEHSIPELLQRVDAEARGQKQYAEGNRHPEKADQRESLIEMDKYLRNHGIDIQGTDNETIKKALETNQARATAPKDFFDFAQNGGDKTLGGITFHPDKTTISLLKDADLSTFLHETGHLFTKVLGDIAARPDASERTKEIYQALREFAGADESAPIRDKIKRIEKEIERENNKKELFYEDRNFENNLHLRASRQELEDLQKKPASDFTREQHEKIAEGFEKYLMEGKAPTSKLREAFASFKAWMIHAYKTLMAHPDVTLTPEVRNAFDRMLATDEELADARNAVGLHPLFSDPHKIMNPDDAAKYTKTIQEARAAANDDLTAKNMKAVERERSKQYKIERKSVEDQITAEVNGRPEYKLLGAIKSSELPDGTKADLKLDRKSLVRDFGKEIVREMPRGIFEDGGLHYEQLADLMGMDSGHELVMTLANTLPKEDVIRQEVDNEMRARYAYEDPAVNGQMQEEAMKAVHNAKESARLAFELKWIMDNKLGQYKDLMRKVGKRVLTAAEFKKQADTITATLSTRDLKPYLYQRAETKAANDAMDYALKGAWDKAFESKYQEFLNHELYKAVSEAQEDVQKSVDDFKDFNKKDEVLSKSRDMNLINAGRVILDKIGIGSVERGKEAEDYLKKLKSYGDPDQYNETMTQIQSLGTLNHYGDMPYGQFQAVKDSINAIWDLAKLNRQIEIQGQQMDRAEVIGALSTRIDELDADKTAKSRYYGEQSKMDNFKTGLLGVRAQLRRIEHWCDAMDGGNPDGSYRKYIWNPVFEGANKFRDESSAMEKKINALVQEHLKDMSYEAIPSDELEQGSAFKDKTFLLGAVLHSGNESNLRKLLLGYGWGHLDDNGNLDRSKWDEFIARMTSEGVLTKHDYDFVQGVWDLMEETKPDAQRAHKQRYGRYFSEITAEKFDTPFGEYKGGYYPAVVDRNVSLDPKNREAKALLDGDSQSSLFPRALNGFTKNRVEGYSAPLSLNLNLITSHIDQVLKFAHISPAVHDVARIVLDKEFSRKLTTHDSAIVHEALVPWLDRSVQQSVSSPGRSKTLDGIFKYLRNNSGMQIMFLNVKNVLQQVHGLSVAAVKVAPSDIAQGIKDYAFAPKATADMIAEKSTFMRNKLSEHGIEMEKTLRDITLNQNPAQKVGDFLRKNTYFLQTAAQNMVNIAVWKGAYDGAISQGHNESDAVNIADGAISQTQHNFAPESISSIEHQDPFMRMFTMFYSYFNMKANLLGSEFYKITKQMGLKQGLTRGLYVYGAAAMLPSIIMVAMSKGLSGNFYRNGDQDDWDDFLSQVGLTQLHEATGMVPIAGQFANAALNKFTSQKSYDDRVATSPAFEALGQAAALPAEAYLSIKKDKMDKHLTKDALTTLGLITGTPAGVLSKPIGYLNAVSSGKAHPTGAIDFTRGLITGQKGR